MREGKTNCGRMVGSTMSVVLLALCISVSVCGAALEGGMPTFRPELRNQHETKMAWCAAAGSCSSSLRLRGAGEEGGYEGGDAKMMAIKEKEAGNELYKKKNFEGALAHYQKAVELDPTNMVLINNVAAALFGQHKYEECMEKVKEAIEVGKTNRADFKDLAKGYARLANALVKLGRLEEAVKSFDDSLMEFRDPQVELKRKQTINAKQEKESKEYINPEKAEEERQEGNKCFKEGKWVDAIKHYTEGLKRDPNNHLLYSNRGQTYIKVMDLGSALKDCDRCIELKPDFPRAYARKATVQLLCKQTLKAKQTVETGLAMAPQDPELLQARAKVMAAVRGVGMSQEEREQCAQEAMKDPQVAAIMQDPMMRQVLSDMQTNPSSAQKHMQNPEVAKKIEILVAAGIIQTG